MIKWGGGRHCNQCVQWCVGRWDSSFSTAGCNVGWITSESRFDCQYGHRFSFSQLHPGRRIQEDCVLLGHYAANSTNFCTDVSEQPLGPILKAKNPKRKPTRWVIGSTMLPIHLVPGDTFSNTRVAAGWC